MSENMDALLQDKLKRVVEVTPAYDKRNEGLGQLGANLLLYVKGKKGVVSCVFLTGWYLGETSTDFCGMGSWDIHSYKELEESCTLANNCEYLEGMDCYCYGSSLRTIEKLFPLLKEKGSSGLLDQLEKDYWKIFYPSTTKE
jgi:hypothetical protein